MSDLKDAVTLLKAWTRSQWKDFIQEDQSPLMHNTKKFIESIEEKGSPKPEGGDELRDAGEVMKPSARIKELSLGNNDWMSLITATIQFLDEQSEREVSKTIEWPEEKKYEKYAFPPNEDWLNGRDVGYNQAIKDCKAAYEKMNVTGR
jgi:hypothetical protein